MTTEEAVAHIQRFLTQEFGKLLQMRSVGVHRTAAGRVWRAQVVCMTSSGELPVGTIGVDETGAVAEKLGVDDLVQVFHDYVSLGPGESALAAFEEGGDESETEEHPVDSPEAGESFDLDLVIDEESGDASDPTDSVLDQLTESYESVWNRVSNLLKEESSNEELMEARELLPRLLSYPEQRGKVLSAMACVELQLGYQELALDYMEASARDLSDHADVTSLEGLCNDVRELFGEEFYMASKFVRLLEQTRRRLLAVDSLEQVPILAGLPVEAHETMKSMAVEKSLPEDTDLLKEGEPSVNLYFIKEGRCSVRLETPDGTIRTVTSLVPGDIAGESSVLTIGDAFCNATIRTELETTVWMMDGGSVRELLFQFPELRQRLAQARQMRRIHSFLSMHPTIGELDSRDRDELLACVTGLETVPRGTILIPGGQTPKAGYLLVTGAVHQRIKDQIIRLYGHDDFFGFRDSLHGITSECEYLTIEETNLAVFSAEKLLKFGLSASPNVVSVLERLG